MRYQTVLFDLDGTLTDPQEGITKSVAYALKAYGINVPDRSALRRFIGPPLVDSFMEEYGFGREKALEAVEKYRERFRVKGLYENRVYDGIPELLSDLRANSIRLMVATSKPTVFAEQILSYFGLRPFFDFVAGAELDGSRDRKADVIRYALEENQITEISSVLMIGDRLYDIVGAQQNNLASMGVLYGFGSREELEQAGADLLAATPGEIAALLLM